jgi:hypothetical protein
VIAMMLMVIGTIDLCSYQLLSVVVNASFRIRTVDDGKTYSLSASALSAFQHCCFEVIDLSPCCVDGCGVM